MVSATDDVLEEVYAPVNEAPIKLDARDVSIYYDDVPAIEGVTLKIREHEIFGIIGPANAGKT